MAAEEQPSLTGVDRREAYRAHYYADVEIEWGPSILRARTTDISLDGMMVETPSPLAAGTEFRARVFLGEGAPLEAECVVKQVFEGKGMGVSFADLKPADQARLRKLLAGLPH
jgi:c-di-GMP-binding flagellar brake protein YcgR